jgi:hypothetical protein
MKAAGYLTGIILGAGTVWLAYYASRKNIAMTAGRVTSETIAAQYPAIPREIASLAGIIVYRTAIESLP